MMFDVRTPHLIFTLYLVWCCGRSRVQGIACSPCQCSYSLGGILDCSGRNITNLTECDPLDSCPGALATLNFSGNALTEIGELYIYVLSSGEGGECYLDFSRNVISEFSGTFSYIDCQSLTLDLSFNAFGNISLTSFQFEIYSGVVDLEILNFKFTRNKIRSLQWLNLFDVHNFYRIGNMTIDLSFNEIVALNDFKIILYYGYIEKLNVLLNNNNVTTFGLSAFMGSRFRDTYSIYIDLSDNDISHFTREDMENYVILDVNIRFNFSGNILNCDCSQRFISNISSPIRGILGNYTSVETTCAEPSSISGRPILSLSPEEFTCSPELDPMAVLVHEVTRGETVEIRCPFIGADPLIEYIDWEFVSDAIQGEASSFQFRSTCVDCPLVIWNVQPDTEGKYRCTVSNGETLTISQTLRLLPGDQDGITTSSITSPQSSVTAELINDTASPPPVQEGQAGLLAVVIILSFVSALTASSLIAVSYKLYLLKNGAVKSDKEVTAKYRSKPRVAAHPYVQNPGQENTGYRDDDGSYEIPRSVQVTSKPTGGDEDIYEIKEQTVTG